MKEEKECITPKKTFSVVRSERHFKDKVLVSYYNKSDFEIEKKYKPFVYNGYKYRLNLETGELEYYDMKTCNYCRGVSLRRTKILLAMLLEMNDFDYFCTFTFDKSKLDREDDRIVYKKFQLYCKYLRKKFSNLAYLTVPERHKVKLKFEEFDLPIYIEENKGAIHFHMLLKLNGHTLKELGFKRTKKVCCSWATQKNGICSEDYYNRTKDKYTHTITDGLPIFNITKFRHGYTTASRIASPEACKSYVAKYISKSIGVSTEDFKKRFYYSKNLEVPDIVKEEVGCGFEEPIRLKYDNSINEIKQVRIAEEINKDISSYYNKNYNVLQAWFPEDKFDSFMKNKDTIGIITDQKTPFDEEQINIYDITKE